MVTLKTLIDPGGAAIGGEDDQRNEDEAKQEGEDIFFHGGLWLSVDCWWWAVGSRCAVNCPLSTAN